MLLPLRLFLGVTFVYAGLQKLTDPQYFRPTAAGYIGRQIAAFASGTPLHGFLTTVALPHAVLFGALVAWGELAIGLGTLAGLLLRPAAFFGLVINAIFFLSATWRVHPYFYGADIVFAFGWMTLLLAGAEGTGGLALDCWLAPEVLARLVPEQHQAAVTRGLALLVGIAPEDLTHTRGQSAAEPVGSGGADAPAAVAAHQAAGRVRHAPTDGRSRGVQARAGAGHRSRYTVRPDTSRRQFLWGLASGVAGTVLVGLFGRLIGGSGDGTQGGSGLTGGTTGTGATSTTGGASATAGTGVLAQSSAVADNSAVSFTIPSNGDPGVLVRLNSGQFVAYDATCTHAGCPVQYDTGSGLLICPCHGAEFDPANGAAVVQGPAATPLTSVPITVDAHTGNVTLSG